MIIRTLILVCLLLSTYGAVAVPIRLDFSVDIHQKNITLTESFDPNITIPYSITLDDSSFSVSSGSYPGGRRYQLIRYTRAIIENTKFSDEVLSEIEFPLSIGWKSATIYREFVPDGYGSGEPLTFESIMFTYDRNTGPPGHTNTVTSYQVGVQRQGILGPGDLVNDITDPLSYFETLIGASEFYFNDFYLTTYDDPVTRSGTVVDMFGYSGHATLLQVVRVPEPSGFFLMAWIGLLWNRNVLLTSPLIKRAKRLLIR